MCGIAGFSLNPNSKVNARELGHNLLTEIEWRGTMASGFAFGREDGFLGYYKNPIRGSQLSLKGIPRDAKTAIFHTRQTTHGTEQNNDNNHPVISQNGQIALIHNGVIWNEQEVRFGPLKDIRHDLPEVDTSVIAGVIQEYGLEGLGQLSGDMAIAWLVNGSPNILNLARPEGSPVAYTWLMDGSFVFASTAGMLMNALITSDLPFGHVFIMDERAYVQVDHGVIVDVQQTPETASYDWGYSVRKKADYRAVTAGGHAWDEEDWEEYGKYDESFDGMFPGEKRAPVGFANVYKDDMDEWEFKEGGDGTLSQQAEEAASEAFHTAMALLNGAGAGRYYTMDDAGDTATYYSMDQLENALTWWASRLGDEDHYGAEGPARWVEKFIDIGNFDVDGTTMVSWVDDPEETYNHEDPKGESLGYIREGIGLLKAAIGR